jgi:TonB family protein
MSSHGLSLVLHGILAFALLHRPAAEYLKVNPVSRGNGGSSIELVVFGSTERERSQIANEIKQITLPPTKAPQLPREKRKRETRHPDVEQGASAAPSRRAGQTWGSSRYGALSGPDIRPAIPVTWADPDVLPWQVPSGVAGKVIVEITIDADGSVIDAQILQPLGHGIDEKVLAAVTKWRFRPATRDGVPIASKQDVVYSYPS